MAAGTELEITTLDRISHLRPVESRDCGLGGSEVAGILGMSPWLSPWDVYAKKTGMVERSSPMDNRKLWGRKLERLIADGYAETRGCEIDWLDITFQHPDRKFQILTPDFVCRKEPRGGDAKCVATDQIWHWGPQGSDAVPEQYALQCAWYLSATGLDSWDLAVLVGGNDLRIYSIYRDKEIEAVLLEEAEKFWVHNVLAGVAPPIGATDTAAQYLRQRFPKNRALMREATERDLSLIEQYETAKAGFDEAKDQKESLENAIKESIAEHDGIQFPGGRVTWKLCSRSGYTVAPTEYRKFDFRRSKK